MNKRIRINGVLYEANNIAPRKISNWKVKEEPKGYSLDTDIQIGDNFFIGQILLEIRNGNLLVSYQVDNFLIDETVFSSEIDLDLDDLVRIMESSVPVIDNVIKEMLRNLTKRYRLSDLFNVCVYGDSYTKSEIRSIVAKGVSKVSDSIKDIVDTIEEEKEY